MNLEEMREVLEREAEYVDIKHFSHKVTSLTLEMIKDNYGTKEVNQAIEDFDLEDLGWEKVKE